MECGLHLEPAEIGAPARFLAGFPRVAHFCALRKSGAFPRQLAHNNRQLSKHPPSEAQCYSVVICQSRITSPNRRSTRLSPVRPL